MDAETISATTALRVVHLEAEASQVAFGHVHVKDAPAALCQLRHLRSLRAHALMDAETISATTALWVVHLKAEASQVAFGHVHVKDAPAALCQLRHLRSLRAHLHLLRKHLIQRLRTPNAPMDAETISATTALRVVHLKAEASQVAFGHVHVKDAPTALCQLLRGRVQQILCRQSLRSLRAHLNLLRKRLIHHLRIGRRQCCRGKTCTVVCTVFRHYPGALT